MARSPSKHGAPREVWCATVKGSQEILLFSQEKPEMGPVAPAELLWHRYVLSSPKKRRKVKR